ncbi:MAG: V-type ATP synthase subunit C [Clostridia bacterium]
MAKKSAIYGVARVRVLETKLLTANKIDRMLDAATPQDVLKVLAESEYGVFLADIKNTNDYEIALSKELARIYELVLSLAPEPEVFASFRLKYDVHNMKVLLKERYFQVKSANILSSMGNISMEKIQEIFKSEDLLAAIPESYRPYFLRIEQAMANKLDPQIIDIQMDTMYYELALATAKKHKVKIVEEYFVRLIDITNIKTLLRVTKLQESVYFMKSMLLPGGEIPMNFFLQAIAEPLEKWVELLGLASSYRDILEMAIQEFIATKQLTSFEAKADNQLLANVRAQKYNPFGIESILGYLLAKETEVKLIRIIMVGKTNQIDAAKIRERMREVYV